MASLRLVLEVCQFARDASVAEAWLIAQEPYVTSKDLGQNVDEVEKLLKRHEAFEKSTATWEERFSALERLTTVCKNLTRDLQQFDYFTCFIYPVASQVTDPCSPLCCSWSCWSCENSSRRWSSSLKMGNAQIKKAGKHTTHWLSCSYSICMRA